jgi:NO-binding membrane sensor protein with MHYT domain
MSNSTGSAPALVGTILPQSYNPGFVVLSYVVSFIGAVTTLELLHRRTSARGFYNWYARHVFLLKLNKKLCKETPANIYNNYRFLLFAAANTMGGISIWSMHMVGNRAIILGNDGDSELQIIYNVGFTVLSYFVPTIVLMLAFLLAGAHENVQKIRIIAAGAAAGLAICGMHYLGQAGISNYHSIYNIGHVVGAALIAVFASITALYVFFSLRAKWKNSWWKRGLCAALLACAVSGMHWTAATGTRYRLETVGDSGDSGAHSDVNRTVIIVIVFALVACSIVLGLAILTQHRRSQQSNRAQQVVVACAYFDSEGRLMVTPEGMMPSRKISNSYLERSFDDVFSESHPVFLWLYRATRNWAGLADLVPGVRAHIREMDNDKTKTRPSSAADYEGKRIDDYSMLFRELFILAASELAAAVNVPLAKIGALHDEILQTGVFSSRKSKILSMSSESQLEAAIQTNFIFGRGQMLFLVKKANKEDASRLQAAGYRFTSVQNIIDILARSMQVGREDLEARLDSMQQYEPDEHIIEQGVHLACFAVRASVRSGFDILVRQSAKNQLPSMQLPVSTLEAPHMRVIEKMDGLTVIQCISLLKSQRGLVGMSELNFARQFYDTLQVLIEDVADPFFSEALLCAQTVAVPCRALPGTESRLPGKAILIAFRIIVPIHVRAPRGDFMFSPLSLFRAQQCVYPGALDHEVFARRVHRELASVVEQSGVATRLPTADGVSKVRNTIRNSVSSMSHSASNRGSPRLGPGSPTPSLRKSSWWGTNGSQNVDPNKANTAILSVKENPDSPTSSTASSGDSSDRLSTEKKQAHQKTPSNSSSIHPLPVRSNSLAVPTRVTPANSVRNVSRHHPSHSFNSVRQTPQSPTNLNPFDPFQGILVSQSVSVDVKDAKADSEMEMDPLGTSGMATTEDMGEGENDGEAWVGSLFRGIAHRPA